MNNNKPTVQDLLNAVINAMQESKPNDRSDTDRLIQIAITDQQKVLAWWIAMVEQTTRAAA